MLWREPLYKMVKSYDATHEQIPVIKIVFTKLRVCVFGYIRLKGRHVGGYLCYFRLRNVLDFGENFDKQDL